jgi:hypothetical protein
MADKVLVLDTTESRDRAVEFMAERRKVLTAVTSTGAKVHHDRVRPPCNTKCQDRNGQSIPASDCAAVPPL